ncbi:GAP family protein [Candidatus Woesearchaeota archaeon]|nr:GAP family protein [Candidatus Woesearchaeota archaeon]
MVVEATLPTIGVVLVTALIDSINPCAIGVLILLVSTLLATKNKDKMLKIGLIYIAAIYITYFLAGLGLTAFLANIPQSVAEYIAIIVGTIIIVAGIIEIKDFFWYGQGFSLMIPARRAKQIHNMMKKVSNMSVPAVIILGIFVAAVELPCTGGPYLAITLLLSQNFSLTAVWLLLIYNVIFVMPLVVILLMVLAGKNVAIIKQFKQNSRTYIRLVTGVILILLGWLLILIANGTINVG